LISILKDPDAFKDRQKCDHFNCPFSQNLL
jgi:hypothetical protein